MKAITCREFSASLKLGIEEMPKPTIKPHQVLIKSSWMGVNFPDTLIVRGLYQIKPDFPFSPGQEVCGEVVEVGSSVSAFRKGDRVVSGVSYGAFAEYVAADSSNTFIVPPTVKSQEAAALIETYGTAFHALKDRAELKPGETLLVLGASGGTGTAAVQLGNLFGARVIAVASTEEKRNFAKSNGAHEVLASDESLKENVKKLGGADVIFDPVGGHHAEQVFRTLNPGGRHLVVGFASGEIPKIPFNIPLLKSAALVGVFWGNFWRQRPEANAINIKMLLKWLDEEKIKPQITREWPLEDAAQAMKMLTDRSVIGKVVLKANTEQ